MKIEYQDLKIESATSKIEQKEQMYQSGYGSDRKRKADLVQSNCLPNY